MTTYNTGNPIGSLAAQDLLDNAQNLDVAMNAQSDTWEDRLHVTRPTVAGAIKTMTASPHKTLAALIASAAPAGDGWAIVTNDTTSANNGYYTWTGSAWVKSSLQPLRSTDLINLNAPSNFSDSYAYRTAAALDANTLVAEGNYLMLTGSSNVPASNETGFLTVRRMGAFAVQTLFYNSKPAIQYQRRGAMTSGVWSFPAWSEIGATPGGLNAPANFADNYAYRTVGVLDANTLVIEGSFILSVGSTNLSKPSVTPSDVAYMTVSRMGSFAWQTVRYTNEMNVLYQRRGILSSGAWTWMPWSGIGQAASSVRGKKIAFIGDSLIERDDYPALIASRLGATSVKFGFGGCRAGRYPSSPLGFDKMCMYRIADNIATGDYSSLIAGAEWVRDNTSPSDDNTPQALAMSTTDWSTVDVLFLAWGANDWTGGDPAGDATPTADGSTYSGSLAYAIERIQTAYPHLKIGLISPSFRLTNGAPDPELNSDTVELGGRTMIPLVESLELVRKKYRTPVCDMYWNSGINRQNWSRWIPDGVHPATGHGVQLWADKVGSWIAAEF